MKRILHVLAITIFLLSGVFQAKAFMLDAKGLDSLHTAVLIADLTTDSVLVQWQIDTPLVPASITKAVTSLSLLSVADSDECFKTEIRAEGRILDNGCLEGNLVIYPAGDPTIESIHFPDRPSIVVEVYNALAFCGIKSISGKIIIDESRVSDATVPKGWLESDLSQRYGTGLRATNFHDNIFTLSLPSGTTTPTVPGFKVIHKNVKNRRMRITNNGRKGNVTVSGRMRSTSLSMPMPDPAEVMACEITQFLVGHGVEVANREVVRSRESELIAVHHSPTFGEILRSLMVRSDNLMAEAMLRAIAPEAPRSEALLEERLIWSDLGLPQNAIEKHDGSGLSRHNRLTARFLWEVLKIGASPEYCDDYVVLFPKAGQEGTVRKFLTDTELEGRVVLKSGSLNKVKSYMGYVLDTEDNPTHAIVFIANNFTCPSAVVKNQIENLLLEKFGVSLQSTEQTILSGDDDENEAIDINTLNYNNEYDIE